MLPSLVGPQLHQTVVDFLQTTFAFTDPRLSEALARLAADPSDGLFKGPYVSLRLPFVTAAPDERAPFGFDLGHRPYRHQLTAYQRLTTQNGHQPQNTLVTTGTGSGKTECFLFPILDYCLRMRKQGREGIKAIVLYPMNALANDQARRFAEEIHKRPELAPLLTAGLYIGDRPEGGPQETMDEERVITSRDLMCRRPPDILLTNYRMLDYLLMRPYEQRLWQYNEGADGADVLRYLVLDELHTYDGAQGSDVACLIRRLRGRLGIAADSGGFVCVGTSATVSGRSGRSPEEAAADGGLLSFASDVFGRPFDRDAVIGETRLAPAQLLTRVGGDRPASRRR